ncbi:general secretion pathway protein GspK [Stakelama sp. CBK3Z-3]|uniref:Type II secretion system protein K n=1 Tax=Stakelama flava TaxID=2860338 RepID=A0ABS6XJE2_9SPHN|nr:type II secretion system protein GspK [Stakelama flava]MBW4330320.1 general secretion pathway protein GspK [Stakelama flava]
MILVNVLLFVAIASGLVLLMINREELALDHALRSSEAARALAVARGGEMSAVVALRRDLIDAPGIDYAGEPWGALQERDARIDGGTFDLSIADAQGRFNINNVREHDASDLVLFRRIALAAGLNETQALAAAQLVREYGPVSDLRPIRLTGIDPAVADRLETMVTALPGKHDINLNTATPELMALLFHDPATVDRLLSIRRQRGYLTKEDFSDAGLPPQPGTGFTSDVFWVHSGVTLGGTRQEEAALIVRDTDAKGVPHAAAVERWRNAAIPPEVPDFPAPAGQ